MKKRFKVLILLVFCFAVLTGAAYYLIQIAQQEPPTVVCPDGTIMELAGVTYGKQHYCPMDHPWTRFLQALPTSIQQKIGVRLKSVHKSKEDILVVWLVWKGRTTSWNGNKHVIDENGFASRLNSGWGYQGKPSNPALTEQWLGYAIPTYPKRDASFTFKMSDWNEKEIAAFEIKNPHIREIPPLQAEALPVARTVDDMEFALVALEMPHPERPPKDMDARFNSSMDVRATFEIKEAGEIVEHWQPVNIWLEDATSNKTSNTSWSNQEKDGKASITFSSGLFPGESWKIRTQFARKDNFLEEDKWTVEIPLPGSPGYQTNLVAHTIREKKIIIRGVVDENGMLLDGTKENNRSFSSNQRKKHREFKIRVEDMNTDLRLDLVEVIDDQGRTCKDGGKSWGGGDYAYRLNVEDDAQRLKVTVALHASKFAEFYAEPTVLEATETEDP